MSKTIKNIEKTIGTFEKTIADLESHAITALSEATEHQQTIDNTVAARDEVLSAADRALRFKANLQKLLS